MPVLEVVAEALTVAAAILTPAAGAKTLAVGTAIHAAKKIMVGTVAVLAQGQAVNPEPEGRVLKK